MTYHVEVDTSDADNELKRLSHSPATDDILRLESVLAGMFVLTQAAVHIDTHSLKTSGRIESSRRRHTWNGSIIYGGIAPGAVHDPVTYAQAERARGGDHDFLWPIYGDHAGFIRAMLSALEGDL